MNEVLTSTKDINTIYQVMRNQPRSAQVQLKALDTMYTICREPAVANTILESVDGGLKPLLVVLCRYRFNEDIQIRGMQIISLIAKASREASGLVGRCGTIKVIANNLNARESFSRRHLQTSIWALNEIGKFKKNMSRLERERIGLVLRRARRIMMEDETRELLSMEAVVAAGGAGEAAEMERSRRRRRSSFAQIKAVMAGDEETPEQIQVKQALAKLDRLKKTQEFRLILPLKLRRLMKRSDQAKEEEEELFATQENDGQDDEDEDEKLVVQELDPVESDVELENVIRECTLLRRNEMEDIERRIDEKRQTAANFKH